MKQIEREPTMKLMAISIVNNAQPCGLEHIKKSLLTRNNTGDTLFTKASILTIYGKFDISLLEINQKFVLASLISILDALVNGFYNFMEGF